MRIAAVRRPCRRSTRQAHANLAHGRRQLPARACLPALAAACRAILEPLAAPRCDLLGPRARVATGRRLPRAGALPWRRRTRPRGA